jgi:hypothetical protein
MDYTFDVIVIGGGPAGMIAAGRAAESGAAVLLLEKNKRLGEKLLITGKGRCNITRAEFDSRILAKAYARKGDFLISPFSVFGVEETISFFNKKGLKTKIERGQRVFPQSNKAKDVLIILLNYLRQGEVKIMANQTVKNVVTKDKKITKIVLSDRRALIARNYIIATGGKAFPGTGSTGDGYRWLKKMGHTIEKPKPALVPVKIKESWPKKNQGLSLKNVGLTVLQNDKKKDTRFGEMIFTHFGISGPIVLDLSYGIGQLLEKGRVKISLDLKPALDFEALDKRVQSDFKKYSNKLFRNALDDLLPQKIIQSVIKLSGIDPSKKVNKITKEERHRLVRLLKNMEMEATGLLGFDMAIITAGGVAVREIEAKTMQSKIIDNLFLAGEVINLHGPTGGYNLQLCWSTGYLAGQSAALNKKSSLKE